MKEERLYLIKEVMSILNVSRSKVNTLIKNNDLESVKLGDKKQSAIRIKKSSLDRYLNRE